MKGKISISRIHDSITNGDSMKIYIEDEQSSIQFAEIEMNLEDFARAITGMSHQECTFLLRNIENIGKHRQFKKCRIPYTPMHNSASLAGRMEKRRTLAPYEVDGWRGNDSDLGNYHRGNIQDGYVVTFMRFVDEGNSEEISGEENKE